VIYHDTLDDTFAGRRLTEYVVRAYVADGRDLAIVTIDRCCQDLVPQQIEELLRTVSQRLAIHAPK